MSAGSTVQVMAMYLPCRFFGRWWPKLREGGLFAGHDFVPDGTHKEGAFGVQGAVSEFALSVAREVLSISDKDRDSGRSEPQHADGGWTTWYFIK